MTIHLIILGIGVVTVLLTIGGIVTSSRVIIIYTTVQRQVGLVSYLLHANTHHGVSWPSGLAYRTQVLVLAAESRP